MSTPRPPLTRRQRDVLAAIREHIARFGWPPTLREIGQAAGLASTSTVHAELGVLVTKGYIRRDERRPRAVVILDGEGHPCGRVVVGDRSRRAREAS